MQPTTPQQPIIRAVNKKTGKVFEGTVDEARKFGFSEDFIASKLEASKKISDLTNPTQGVGTDTQKFNQNQALTSVLQAEQFYSPGTDKSLALASDATRQSKAKAGGQALIKSFTDPDYQQRLNEFKGQMNLVVGGLTQLSGSGAPQADEAKRLLAAAPNETSTDAEAKAWFKAVKALGGLDEATQQKTQTQNAQGAQQPATGETPQQPQPPTQDTVLGRASTGNPILDLLKGFVDPALTNIRNYAQDVGAGIGQNTTRGVTEQGTNQATEMAQKLEERAKTVTDPIERQKLLKLAGETYSTLSGNAANQSQQYSSDIKQNYAKRGLDVGSSVATLADMGINLGKIAKNPKGAVEGTIDAIKGGKDKIASVLKLGGKDKSILEEGINLANEGKNIRNTAVELSTKAGKTFDGSNTANDIFKWGQNAIAAGENEAQVNKIVSQAINTYDGKLINASKGKEFWDAADKAFSENTGLMKDNLKASYQVALRDSLRKDLDKIAPGFEKGTNMISEGLHKNKILSKVSTEIEKAQIKNQMKGPLRRILGSTPVKIAAGVYGGEKVRGILGGQ